MAGKDSLKTKSRWGSLNAGIPTSAWHCSHIEEFSALILQSLPLLCGHSVTVCIWHLRFIAVASRAQNYLRAT